MQDSAEKVIAILCADFHLSLNPPIWRSVEPNWFEAMKRPLNEIKGLQEKYDCPVICAGDVFHRWNSPPELINFAYDHLPKMYSIPGQHDLPLHKYEDIKKSAYLSLVNTDIIQNILPGCRVELPDIVLEGYPFGYQIQPLMKQERQKDKIHIAVVHEYRCTTGKSYSNAPEESYLRKSEKDLLGYDIIMYGDNHQGFVKIVNINSIIFNCGTLMRRNSDEINYNPQVGLLLESGEVCPYQLDVVEDKYLEIQNTVDIEGGLNLKTFIRELEKLGNTDLDFHDAMKQYLRKNKISGGVCNIILKAMEL